jgi:uncharacterized protein YjbI with pentapeptide repeats
MADEEQLARLKEGVDVWNRWRKENPDIAIDLRGAKLKGADLEGAYLDGADLIAATLNGANLAEAVLTKSDLADGDLQYAKLEGAWLSEANLLAARLENANLAGASLQGVRLLWARLQHANLGSANLDYADLAEANLSNANLGEARLENCNLRGASLDSAEIGRARLRGVNFGDVDLRKVGGLADVVHHGPSSVDHLTLAKSRGQIPEAFLKGCGFQDWEVAAAKLHDPDLSGDQVTDILYEIDRLRGESPIQINPLFISYSREDCRFVETLEPRFDQKRIRYWRDVHHSTAGPLEEQIDRAIRVNPTFLLVLSEHSVESDWVEMETEKARRLEKELRRRGEPRHVLCPVGLDAAWETAAWPERLMNQIKKYNILDFSGWEEEEALEGMFGRLLEGLGIYYRQSE